MGIEERKKRVRAAILEEKAARSSENRHRMDYSNASQSDTAPVRSKAAAVVKSRETAKTMMKEPDAGAEYYEVDPWPKRPLDKERRDSREGPRDAKRQKEECLPGRSLRSDEEEEVQEEEEEYAVTDDAVGLPDDALWPAEEIETFIEYNPDERLISYFCEEGKQPF